MVLVLGVLLLWDWRFEGLMVLVGVVGGFVW